MGLLGRIGIKLHLDSAQFLSDIGKNSRALGKFAKDMGDNAADKLGLVSDAIGHAGAAANKTNPPIMRLSRGLRLVGMTAVFMSGKLRMATGAIGILGMSIGVVAGGLRMFTAGATLAAGAAKAVARAASAVTFGAISKAAGFAGDKIKSVFQQIPGEIKKLALTATVAAGALVAFGMHSARSIDEAGQKADTLGTTASNLMALRYAASTTGVSAEDLGDSLKQMNVNLARAVQGTGPAAAALKALKLDPKDLAAMDRTKAFTTIAGKISTIANPSEKAAMAMDVFTESGLKLIGTINKGPAEIDRLMGEFTAIGGVSASAQADLIAMNRSVDKLGIVASAAGGKLAAKFAPYVTASIQALTSFATSGDKTGRAVEYAFNVIRDSVQLFGQALDLAQVSWYGFQAAGLKTIASLTTGFADLRKSGRGLLSWVTGETEDDFGELARITGENLQIMADQAEATRAKLAAAPSNFGDKFKSAFDKVTESAEGMKSAVEGNATAIGGMSGQLADATIKAGEMIKKLTEQRDTFGMTSTGIDLYHLKQEGASAATIASAKSIADEIQALEQAQKKRDQLKTDATALFEATRTPLEKFKAEIEKIQTLKFNGAINADVAARGMKAAKESFMPANAPTRAKALEFGSAEARNAVMNFRDQGKSRPADETAKATKETAKASAQAAGLLERLLAVMSKSGTDALPVAL